jgi:hypothetical protein
MPILSRYPARKGGTMAFKRRREQQATVATDSEQFRHASGYSDLAGVLGDHTLDAAQEAAAAAPRGYRSRSVGREQPRRP